MRKFIGILILIVLLACSAQAEQYYLTEQDDLCYHAYYSCGGAIDVQPISPEEAEAGGRYPCPICIQDNTEWESDASAVARGNTIILRIADDDLAKPELTGVFVVTVGADGSSFADVKSGVYYGRAVIWAAANGIVTGTGSASFSPDAKVTREQLAAILYRYAQYRNLAPSANAKLNGFSDADNVSGYASAALGWAVAEGLVNGASGRFMPKGNATRAQVAAIFHRFVENVMD